MRESAPVLPMPGLPNDDDPVVITGIGIGTSLGRGREKVWQGIQQGLSGVRMTTAEDGLGDIYLPCAMVDWLTPTKELKSIRMARLAAGEALTDASIDWSKIKRERFACSVAAQFGDISYLYPEGYPHTNAETWWAQFLPSTSSALIAREFELLGPRLCHSTACASGLVGVIAAMRTIQDGQADIALCGAGEAINNLYVAAFHRMGVLAQGPDPEAACRPFDQQRAGFVMGEGAACLVIEKRSHAIARGATVYAELAGSHLLCQAHHVTSLDDSEETLSELIRRLVSKAGWQEDGPQYVQAHGTGTQQNDRSELAAIRNALGNAADEVMVSSTKGVLGHLINAAGSVELAIAALAIRDGFAPPTMNLDSPDPIGNIDCLPLLGVQRPLDRVLKLSLAFGGHLTGLALNACQDQVARRNPLPLHPRALCRENVPSTAANTLPHRRAA